MDILRPFSMTLKPTDEFRPCQSSLHFLVLCYSSKVCMRTVFFPPQDNVLTSAAYNFLNIYILYLCCLKCQSAIPVFYVSAQINCYSEEEMDLEKTNSHFKRSSPRWMNSEGLGHEAQQRKDLKRGSRKERRIEAAN